MRRTGVRGEVEGESERGGEEEEGDVGQDGDGDVGRECRGRLVEELSRKVSRMEQTWTECLALTAL